MFKIKMSLTTRIFIAMLAGLVFGILINLISKDTDSTLSVFTEKYVISGFLTVLGTMFIRSIMMLVIPLVLVSLICGVAAIGDIKKLGRVGGKTLAFYMFTTAIAITLALSIATLINPGYGLEIESHTEVVKVSQAPGFSEVLIDIVPNNPFMSMVSGNMLQVIFFALLSGIAIASVGKKASKVLVIFEELNAVIMKMITIIMLFAPVGIFALISKVFAEEGLTAIIPLLKYMLTVLTILIVHLIVIYSGALKLIAKQNPVTFFKKFYPTMLVAFSTSSSNATIPLTMNTIEKKMGVSKSISSFSIPFGATINMDGTAIMQGVAVVFIAQAYGISLGITDFLLVIITATLASVGTAGVPGVGLITLSMVLTQVNLPVEGIAIIMGVDRLLDMSRTAVNISGDAIVSIIVAKSENEFNEKTFNNLKAGINEESFDDIEDDMQKNKEVINNLINDYEK